MRLKEREQIGAYLIRRMAKSGSLGSRPEAFSEEKIPFRASVLPEGGQMQVRQNGLHTGANIRLLTGDDLCVTPGDGVIVGEDFYIVQTVNKWTAHIEILCGARA